MGLLLSVFLQALCFLLGAAGLFDVVSAGKLYRFKPIREVVYVSKAWTPAGAVR